MGVVRRARAPPSRSWIPTLAERLGAPLPEAAGDAEAALADAARVLDASVSPSRPLFLAYIGSSGLEIGVLASALAATYDANLATSAGGADRVEEQALRWVADFVGFPLAEGAFTSGGMTSNLTALLAARERALPGARDDGVGGRRAAVYCSDEAHHSIVRAVETCGLGSRAVRRIPIDGARRMRPDALARGARRATWPTASCPVAVVATAGTTLTGAVDPLDAIADVCARARRRGCTSTAPTGCPPRPPRPPRRCSPGLERADSATLDAHKWLGVQKSCSVVLLREAGRLEAAFGHEERYMLHEGDIANPVDRTLEYSRPLRSLRLWMAFRAHGAAQYRAWIEGTLANARQLAELVEAEPRSSSCCTSRCSPPSASATSPPGVEDLDAHNVAARAGDAARRADLPRPRRRRRARLPARVLRELPHHAGRGPARAGGGGGARAHTAMMRRMAHHLPRVPRTARRTRTPRGCRPAST